MSAFLFQAKTLEGKVVKGEVEASNEAEARVRIRAQRLMLLKIAPKIGNATSITQIQPKKKSGGGFSIGGSVKPKELQVFTRQFSTLISAGVPIVQSLEAMVGPGRSPVLNSALKSILEEVSKGRRLAECMKEHPKIFDHMYVNLVHAGEEGGVLDTILNRLAVYIEKSVKLKGRIKGALFYPAAVLVVSALVITLIMIFVIPSFVKMFAQSHTALPWLTQEVINLSHLFVSRWYVIVGVVVAVPIVISNYYKTEDGRRFLDTVILRMPVFGDLILKGAVARFSRTLSTMLSAGVKIVEALDIAAATTKNWPVESVLMKAKDSITKGKSLSDPLKLSHTIPHMVSQMISVGEQTGAMDQMLDKVAIFYEDEVETAADALTSMIEPLMMVFLGAIVGTLVIAMYLPIFNMAATAAGG